MCNTLAMNVCGARVVPTIFALSGLLACDKLSQGQSAPGAQASALASSPASSPAASQAPTGAPPSAVAPVAAPDDKPRPLKFFAGFNRDSKRFAYVDPFDAFGTEPFYVMRLALGDLTATREPEGLSGKDLSATQAKLQAQGFSTERRAPPADLHLDAALGARPPRVTLKRGTSQVDVAFAKGVVFEKDTVAEIWGVSTDQKVVAIHFGPRAQPGKASTYGNHSIKLAAMP